MAGPYNKKRSMGSKFQKPMKRQKRERRVQKEYHSSTEDEDETADQQQDFDAVNLLDSDDDIHNAKVDDIGGDDGSDMSSSDDEAPAPQKKAGAAKGSAKLKAKKPTKLATDDNSDIEEGLPEAEDVDDDEEDDEDDEDMNDEFDLDDDDEEGGSRKPKKRNDPSAFATSLSKILSTKLSTSKRADPVLARSAAAHETSKAKRKAQEKGRVRDVLVATAAPAEEEPALTTAEILATEAKLRKVAQRGVVKMFNAVRAAQVKSSEAERATKQEGLIGMGRREEKVNEMSKKGFLDLLASGGNALKKGAAAIEEA
ncbi:hypothetical protein NLG97_g3210 [Lecanicillium saksenae]|uniref:Uncharacterized protein n=1 Tax=Lecanicillium saksenae TaxID=468837 RepID=A0ACC1QZC1_9HYPO|nr:hypothetical protein NLG97_g3210 [Lecanicillium saksenae]